MIVQIFQPQQQLFRVSSHNLLNKLVHKISISKHLEFARSVSRDVQPLGRVRISPEGMILIHQEQTPTEYLMIPPP